MAAEQDTHRNAGTESDIAPAVKATPGAAASAVLVTEIGETIVIRGKLKCSEDLVVRGRIEADITSDKSVHIEKSGIIKATVKALSARIDGILVGNITADDKIEIAADGRVVGDLFAPRIVIREGAAFRGRIEMPNFGQARATVAPPIEQAVRSQPDTMDRAVTEVYLPVDLDDSEEDEPTITGAEPVRSVGDAPVVSLVKEPDQAAAMSMKLANAFAGRNRKKR